MEGLTILFQIAAFLISILTLYKGLAEYTKNNTIKRFEYLDKLVKEFSENDKKAAKEMLDMFVIKHYPEKDYSDTTEKDYKKRAKTKGDITYFNLKFLDVFLEIERDKDNDKGYKVIDETFVSDKISKEDFIAKYEESIKGSLKTFPKANTFYFTGLERVLRTNGNIYQNDVFIRNSFDSMLDFFLKIIYLLRSELITVNEIEGYFSYYLLRLRDNPAARNYIKTFYSERDFNWLFSLLQGDSPVNYLQAVKEADNNQKKD
ncbi:hypothetical protein GCM10011514_42950 [Emticicia aquatilis]|uniref:Uncharacterized protein n=1 Tax=Emticicia aquatilis TaxID=1537369 RepID=A0A916Z2X6_9BACT|nr:hypothetical protein [Emticicia aquatilis]GGD74260.1 hypothetical protein GCM10011514_42950 [Emticicia aquatilis]